MHEIAENHGNLAYFFTGAKKVHGKCHARKITTYVRVKHNGQAPLCEQVGQLVVQSHQRTCWALALEIAAMS
jgi:hypothetical protein